MPLALSISNWNVLELPTLVGPNEIEPTVSLPGASPGSTALPDCNMSMPEMLPSPFNKPPLALTKPPVTEPLSLNVPEFVTLDISDPP